MKQSENKTLILVLVKNTDESKILYPKTRLDLSYAFHLLKGYIQTLTFSVVFCIVPSSNAWIILLEVNCESQIIRK